MLEEQLVHQTEVELDGAQYQIKVFCRQDGRHFAKTHFDDNDIIISDGLTLHDALNKHEQLLPLAVVSRQLKNPPRRSRSRRNS